MSKRLQMLQALSIFVDIIESVYVKKKNLQVNVWSVNKETILHMSDTDCKYVLAAWRLYLYLNIELDWLFYSGGLSISFEMLLLQASVMLFSL